MINDLSMPEDSPKTIPDEDLVMIYLLDIFECFQNLRETEHKDVILKNIVWLRDEFDKINAFLIKLENK